METPEGDVLVVEVTPSFDTPVRYRGRTFIRIGPRRDIAIPQEKRILSERCAASLPTFDTYPCRQATLDDIDVEVITKEYLPIKLKPLLKPRFGDKSNTLIKDKVIHPLMELKLIAQTHLESPRYPRQKYYLTALGKAFQQYLRS